MRRLAEVFRALADPTRLQILALILQRGEACVCDVEGTLCITQSKSSRHLRYLRSAGLLEDRRDGLWVRYSAPAHPDFAAKVLLDTVRRLIDEPTRRDLDARMRAWQRRKARGLPA